MHVTEVFDYLIIALMCIGLYRVMRKTEALKIMIGIVIFFAVYYVANWLGLNYTASVFRKLSDIFAVGIVVIFYPELRLMLKKLGEFTKIQAKENASVVSIVEEAVFALSEKKTGALIVFDPTEVLTYQSEDMVKIDAVCTSDLLQTIFQPNTALHDGAVIIRGDRIAYAGCKLALSGKKREELGHLGTRHLAAVEAAETYGVIAVVVSEETGNISVATNKGIYRVKSSTFFRNFFQDEKKKEKKLKKSKK